MQEVREGPSDEPFLKNLLENELETTKMATETSIYGPIQRLKSNRLRYVPEVGNVSTRIPGPCDCAVLLGKGTLKIHLRLQNVTWGNDPGLSKWARFNHQGWCLGDAEEKEAGGIWGGCWLWNQGAMSQGDRAAPRSWEQSWAKSQEGNGITFLQLQKTQLCQWPEGPGMVLPRGPSPTDTLILALWDSKKSKQLSPADFWPTELEDSTFMLLWAA